MTGAPGADEQPSDDEELRLSPSETMAHNSAMRVAGSQPDRQKTQKALASIVLGFELFVVVLMGFTLFGLSVFEPRELGLYAGGALALVCIMGLALMRARHVGIVIGWIAHALMLSVAILLPMSLIVSLLFTALWVYCMIKGAQIDRDRRDWIAAQG